jgi:hypothetical protein
MVTNPATRAADLSAQHPGYTHRGLGDRSRGTEHFFLASRLWQPRMGLLSLKSLTSRRVNDYVAHPRHRPSVPDIPALW